MRRIGIAVLGGVEERFSVRGLVSHSKGLCLARCGCFFARGLHSLVWANASFPVRVSAGKKFD